MKRITALLLIFMLLSFIARANEIDISAASAVVIDASSGKVLYEKNANERRGFASTTKIMTALVALERGKLSDVVTVSKNAAGVEGSSIYLKEGEKISLENLLYGLMLESGNDAATAIAEHIAKNEEGFVVLMNEKAKEIGAKSTNFTNPHGLASEEHYTTAKDLALIAAEALKNPDFSRIVKTKAYKAIREGIGEVTYVNHNKLLSSYEGSIGVKTGFTKATGRCLVSAAERGGLRIVCVTICDGDDWNDHKRLSDWAFENYKATLCGRAGTLAKTVSVRGGAQNEVGLLFDEDLYLTEKDEGEWSISYSLPEGLCAPIEKGDCLGEIIAENKSGEKRSVFLVAEKDIAAKNPKKGGDMKEILIKVYSSWLMLFCA